MSDDERQCPFCAETIKSAAIKCKHCGSDLRPRADLPVPTLGELVGRPADTEGHEPGFLKWAGGALVVLFVLYLGLSPLLTVHLMLSAADRRDADALAVYVDFPAVRQDLKEQFSAYLGRKVAAESQRGALTAMFGGLVGGMLVEPVVDAFVTPAGVVQLMRGEQPALSESRPASTPRVSVKTLRDARYRYEAWDQFAVAVDDRDGHPVKFTLRRHGIGWRLTGVRLPLDEWSS